MSNWFFTFGVGKKYGKRRSKYVKISAKSAEEARKLMVKYYGTAWCAQYNEQEMQEIIEKYHTEEYDEGINFREKD